MYNKVLKVLFNFDRDVNNEYALLEGIKEFKKKYKCEPENIYVTLEIEYTLRRDIQDRRLRGRNITAVNHFMIDNNIIYLCADKRKEEKPRIRFKDVGGLDE